MTKKEIIVHIAEKTNTSQVIVQRILQNTLDLITDKLSCNEKIELRNFGIFKTKTRKARISTIPGSKKTIQIPEKRVAVFKPGKQMKEKVQG